MNNIPTKCPSCGSDLIWSETGVDLLCISVECPAQTLYKIEYFLKTLGVEELSATTLEKFNLNSLEEVFTKLSKDYIKSLDGFQEKRANTIYNEIQNSIKNVNSAKLLTALGIPGLGLKNAEKINKKLNCSGYEFFEKLYKVTLIELLSINGIGKKLADCILNNINFIRSNINMLQKYGLSFEEQAEVGTLLNGMNITMTGTAPKMSRPQLEAIVKENGGCITGVSKKSSLLVADNIQGTSSKLKKARDLGIKIITYDDFFKMLNI